MNVIETLKFEIPSNFQFNLWKHHKEFLSNKILSVEAQNELTFRSFILNIKLIGNSQIDLYVGLLSPFDICKLVLEKLNYSDIYDKISFKKWLEFLGKEYRELKLPDDSNWILRLGKNEDRYIHIHPGRSSPNSIRVKASILKSAIVSLASARFLNFDELNLNLINSIRKEFLSLPPLKSTKYSGTLIKIIELFQKYNGTSILK